MSKKKPFFSNFIETQIEELNTQEEQQCAGGINPEDFELVTMKAPSDDDEGFYVTLKYPSDDDEGKDLPWWESKSL